MIKWPERAKAALTKLFEPLQDIDIYIEDTNDEAFYRALLNSVCAGKVDIARVFALGGRCAVIKAAKQHDFSRRRALFLIDGDLHWVRGIPSPNVKGLHQHSAYCIENLLLCEKALALLLSQEAILTEKEAIRQLNYYTWINSILPSLLELFAAFGTAHEVAPTIPTVSRGVGIMCNKSQVSNTTSLDKNKVDCVKLEILNATEKIANKAIVASTYHRILTRLQLLSFPMHGISGKDYLLPLVDFLLQSKGCRIKRRSLRIRLASAGDFERFSALRNAILNAAQGNS